jgi:SAM-dependent methyltransferase
MVVAIFSKLKIFYEKLFPQFVHLLRRELEGCETVLDLGCGKNSPLQHCQVPYSVGVDIFEPYLKESKKKKIHDWYLLADIRKIELKSKSFDCVIAIEVIEHMPKEEGRKLIEKMENIARKKVIITTPNGFLPQARYDRDIFQTHRSGWTIDEFKELGYEVKGIGGLKFLKKERGEFKFKPRVLNSVLSDLTQKITYHFPRFAFQLFAIKNVDDNNEWQNSINCDFKLG